MVQFRSTTPARTVNHAWPGSGLTLDETDRIVAARLRAQQLQDDELADTLACAVGLALLFASALVLRYGAAAMGWPLS